MKLSLCMIVRNEEFFIGDCLSSARPHVDEIIVIDTGSTDDTPAIAQQFSDRILDFTWRDHYAAARNAGLEIASGDWILVLDADELITADGYADIRRLMEEPAIDGYFLNQHTYTDDPAMRNWRGVTEQEVAHSRGYKGYSPNLILRLFRNRADIRYHGRVHEIVDDCIDSKARRETEVVIHHYTRLNPDRPRTERDEYYLNLLEQELEEREDGRLLAMAGRSLMWHRGDYAKAHDYLKRAAALGYHRERSLEEAAEAAYRGGELGIAQDMYLSLYASGYRTPTVCLHRANLEARAGNKSTAISLLKECLSLGGMGPELNAVIERNIAHLSQ